MLPCPICGGDRRVRNRNLLRYCTKCHLIAYRAQVVANRAVNNAVREGALPSLSKSEIGCVDCGKRAYGYDHRDYSRHLDVEPVCRSCNARRGGADCWAGLKHLFPHIASTGAA